MIFVVGNSRSGTTMMGRVLGRSKDVYTFNELHFFEQLFSVKEFSKKMNLEESIIFFSNLISIERDGYLNNKRKIKFYFQESEDLVKSSDKDVFTKIELFNLYLKYESRLNNKNIPCDQTPRNLFYVNEILSAYPDAKIIYMVRDSRNVLLSQKNKWKRRFLGAINIPLIEAIRSRFNYHPILISKLWNASNDKMNNKKKVLKIKFEDFLSSPEKKLMEICEFTNINYEKGMLNIPIKGSSLNKDDSKRLGIDNSKLEKKAQNGISNTELYLCQKITSYYLIQNGYDLNQYKYNPLILIFYYLNLPFVILIALMFNIKRYKNIIESMKKRFY